MVFKTNKYFIKIEIVFIVECNKGQINNFYFCFNSLKKFRNFKASARKQNNAVSWWNYKDFGF